VIVAFNIEIRVETSPERQGFAFSRSLGFFLTGRAEDVLLNFIKMLLGNGLGQRFKFSPITGASTAKPCSSFCTSSTRKNDFRPILAGHHHLSLIVTVEVAGNHAVIHADTRHSGNVVLPRNGNVPGKAATFRRGADSRFPADLNRGALTSCSSVISNHLSVRAIP
jgi:hypothetical protein